VRGDAGSPSLQRASPPWPWPWPSCPGVTPDAGTPAYALREVEGGVIEVRFETDFRDGRALEAELRSYGVDIAVLAIPASPSAVGRIYATEGPAPGETPGFSWGRDGDDTAFRIDPARFRDRLTFHLAVEAEPGETYDIREEVFEPGEVLGGLHCVLGEPVRAAQLVPYLDDLGLTVEWHTIRPHEDGDPGSARTEAVEGVPDGEVMWGYAVDADTVSFDVRPDDAVFDPAYYAPRLSDEPCSPEQAAAWD
jgi:hypothetical protein